MSLLLTKRVITSYYRENISRYHVNLNKVDSHGQMSPIWGDGKTKK